jgi:uncharacterized protein with GYD domain
MPTYVILGNYTHQGIQAIKDSPKRLDGVRKMIKDMGGDLKAFYLTMGRYDFVTVAEAPNDEAVARLLLAVGAAGNVRTVTLKAFPEAEFRKIVAELP